MPPFNPLVSRRQPGVRVKLLITASVQGVPQLLPAHPSCPERAVTVPAATHATIKPVIDPLKPPAKPAGLRSQGVLPSD